ncbi:MAG: DUF4145 domain-containing protein [Promethearchaeota archaeon]
MKFISKNLIFPIIFFTLALVHSLFPVITIDGVTITLIILGLIPWISLIIKEISLPGGIKITFNDLKKPSDMIIDESKQKNIEPKEDNIKSELSLGMKESIRDDSSLALVYFRIEIEKRLRELANRNKIETERKSLRHLIVSLRKKEILSSGITSALIELINYGNKAAHGEEVNNDVIIWVIDYAPKILSILDQIIAKY